MGLDARTALGQLLVEAPPAADGLGVQLRLHAGALLGLLLKDPLGPGAGLPQLAFGLDAHLVRLVLGGPQDLLGVGGGVTVDGAQGEGPAHLVQLRAQHLDLVAEIVGMVDRLLPLLLQPLHLGFELREVV